METLLPYLALMVIGVVLGLEHALETDHVVAVSTLTSQTRSVRRAVLLAASWGIGHTATLFVVSLVILLLRITISDQLGAFFELLVGILLVALGINVLRTVFRGEIHSHAHEHEGVVHKHIHTHSLESDTRHHPRRSFLVGAVHGLAGSTALILLVLSSFQSVTFGLVFIVCFGLGSVVGMCLITILLAIPVKLSLQSKRINQAIQLAAGGVGVVVGVVIILNLTVMGR